jgi:hypothetical protein
VGFQELKNTSFFQAFLVTRDYKMGKSRAKALRKNYFSKVDGDDAAKWCTSIAILPEPAEVIFAQDLARFTYGLLARIMARFNSR